MVRIVSGVVPQHPLSAGAEEDFGAGGLRDTTGWFDGDGEGSCFHAGGNFRCQHVRLSRAWRQEYSRTNGIAIHRDQPHLINLVGGQRR